MAVDNKFTSFQLNLPALFKVGVNPGMTALISAWSSSDDEIVAQLQNTKEQLFVATASGSYLDKLAANYNISRPLDLSLNDSDFSKLIPILSLQPKLIRKTMIALFDLIWGPLFTRANITTKNPAPFNVSPGDTITLVIDSNTIQSYTAVAKDISIPGAATINEMIAIFSNFPSVTASSVSNIVTNTEYLNIRTNTIGAAGSIQAVSGGMVAVNKLNLITTKVQIQNINPHAAIYLIRNKEIIFEIPALVPLLKRTLLGSHHWHADYNIAPPEPNSEFIWEGSFFYSRSTAPGGFTITKEVATLQQFIEQDQIYTTILVNNADNIPNQQGYLIFDFGTVSQEQPVPYFSIPNNNLIFLNPEYKFKLNHQIGANINFLAQLSNWVPNINGQDLPIFLTSSVSARDTAETLVLQLIAAGIIAKFDIILPQYFYPIVPNPYA